MISFANCCGSGDDLPQLTVCRSCHTVLFDGPEMEEPIETIRRYNGACPGCGKTLTFDVANIRIFPAAQDEIEKYPTSLAARPSPILATSRQRMGIASREMPKSIEKPVPLAVWLRRRSSLPGKSTEYESRALSPREATP